MNDILENLEKVPATPKHFVFDDDRLPEEMNECKKKGYKFRFKRCLR